MTGFPAGEAVVELGATPVLPVSIPLGQSGVVVNGAALLYGWSLRESTGAAGAQLDIIDGGDATGQLVATITLTAGESTSDYLAGIGILCRRGVYVHAVSGSVAGAVWITGT